MSSWPLGRSVRYRVAWAVCAAVLPVAVMGCAPAVCPLAPGAAGVNAAVAPGAVYVGTGDPYQPGPLATRIVSVEVCQADAPVAMRILAPQMPGVYAVVLFQHGFQIANQFYDELLEHVASHGFVVVVPQMYVPDGLPIGKPTAAEETARAMRVLDWLPSHLDQFAGVTADTNTLGIAGHSRGGRIAWQLLAQDDSRARAVAGVDPVDGRGGPLGLDSRLIAGPFNFPFPTLVIGAGLASTPLAPLGMACAPPGDNHVQFYAASASPAWHVVAIQGGHLDMLNDDLSDCGIICNVCTTGPDRAGMRRLTAGLLTAFFRGALQGDNSAYRYLTDTNAAPTTIELEWR